jgi:hypothetical protein
MGLYINELPNGTPLPSKGKARVLLNEGATYHQVDKFVPNLVCVVDNGPFEAAAFCYNINEYLAFTDKRDKRPKTWLVWEPVAEVAR